MYKVKQILTRLCAWTHLWQVAATAYRERRLPDSARPGFSIAMLGLFCPFFWIALFTGASREELIFHGCHSALVFLIGLFLMLNALAREREPD